jgi:hypothetical protein
LFIANLPHMAPTLPRTPGVVDRGETGSQKQGSGPLSGTTGREYPGASQRREDAANPGRWVGMSDETVPADGGDARTVRLIFSYDGDEVTLVSQQVVDVPPSGPYFGAPQTPGHYVEVRSAQGDVLAGAAAANAFSGTAEVFPENEGEPIVRVDVEKPRGAFTVLVPAPRESAEVALVRVQAPGEAPEAGAAAAPTPARPEVLATFPLDAVG